MHVIDDENFEKRILAKRILPQKLPPGKIFQNLNLNTNWNNNFP